MPLATIASRDSNESTTLTMVSRVRPPASSSSVSVSNDTASGHGS